MSDVTPTSDKKQIIGTLYSIRAGISYIGEMVDSIKDSQKDTRETEASIRERRKEISSNSQKSMKQRYLAEDLENQIFEKQKKVMECEESIKAAKKAPIEYDGKIATLVIVILFPLIAVGLAFFLKYANSAEEVNGFVSFLLGVGWFATIFVVYPNVIGAFIWALVVTIKGMVRGKRDRKEAVRKLTEQKEEYESEIESLQEEKEIAEDDTPDAIRGFVQANEEIKEEIKKDEAILTFLENFRKVMAEQCRKVYNALVDEYGEFFHPDNWQYLDRVVYYLSTGRADTIRDALNLMDQRLNAEMIANEIRASSNMVAQEIQRSNQMTMSLISECAARISRSVYEVGKTVVKSNAIISDQIGGLGRVASANLAATERMIDAQTLNNALQQKANCTMSELLDDYRVVTGRVRY